MVVREGRSYYKGLIVYNHEFARNHGLEMDDLLDLRGQSFLFVNEQSTSGNTVPRLMFKQLGLNVETFFSAPDGKRTYSYSGGHQQTVNSLFLSQDIERDFMAGAIYDDARDTLARQYPNVYDRLRVLATTPLIPNDPIVIRPNLDLEIPAEMRNGQPIRRYLQDVIQSMAVDWRGRRMFLDMGKIQGFVYGRDKWYDIVRTTYYSTQSDNAG